VSAIVCVMAVLSTFALGEAADGRVTKKDARSLVLAVLRDQGTPVNSRKFELDEQTNPYFPDLDTFYAYFDMPKRLALIGTYAVNPRTAEIWDVGMCVQPRSLSVEQLQKALRFRYRLPVDKGIESAVRYVCT
jgi:hypothetical protein